MTLQTSDRGRDKDLRTCVKRLLWRFGYDLRKFNTVNSHIARRKRLFEQYGINLVLDVGAHTGQYATELRLHGYGGRIASFEPQERAFRQLQHFAIEDPNWTALQTALGDTDSEATLCRGRQRLCARDMAQRSFAFVPVAVRIP